MKGRRMTEPAVNVEDGRMRAVIERITPSVDGGRFAAKRIVGDAVVVEADCFTDGHDTLACLLLWRREGEAAWQETPMTALANDRWQGSFVAQSVGRYQYTVTAWVDHFLSWRHDFARRVEAEDLRIAALVGAGLIEAAAERASGEERQRLNNWAARLRAATDARVLKTLGLDEEFAAVAGRYPDRRLATTCPVEHPLVVDRERARFSSWYEMFPRSASNGPGRHGTFRDCEARLPYVAKMGFDVLYFPPIHPIGRVNRKGANNALAAGPGDLGSPWAIGAAEGGHTALHAELGTSADFRRLLASAHSHGIEIALDIAFQCAPDHPCVAAHPNWFRLRPDGTVQYAENPPKKYQDIFPFEFESEDWRALWQELAGVIRYWAGEGVRIFRVDNPHTKPFAFWEWAITELKREYPDAIFLAEAFTRPKVMHRLAKLGFTQSYTYFTWRTQKWELEQYLTELTGYPERDYYRPNFFVNTPDILPYHLQSGETWMFKSRAALAATLSSTYGVYSGFELLEHEPIPGKEEYLDSEKYEIKVRDWDKPGNIKPYLRDLNRARRQNAALQQTSNLRFIPIDDGNVIGFVKESVNQTNSVIVAIALSRDVHEFWFPLGDVQVGMADDRRNIAALENLITGERYPVEFGGIRLRIDPVRDPAILFRCLA
jgi:starch synthase (maltosyl-transferring)